MESKELRGLNFVLPLQVNNELLVDRPEGFRDEREFLQSKYEPRLESAPDLDLPLALNYLLAEDLVYGPTEEGKTLSPYLLLKRGYGRCGELSTALVALLRAFEIPARQVYVPFWAHCDDNHAWVEYYWQDSWHFVGAAEPEADHDRGWFIAAASRAPLVAARAGQRPVASTWPSLAGGGFLVQSNSLYFKPRQVRIRLYDRQASGQQLSAQEIQVLIHNEGRWRCLSRLLCAEDGSLDLSLNHCSLKLATIYGGAYYELELGPDLAGDIVWDLARMPALFELEGEPGQIASQAYKQLAPPYKGVNKQAGLAGKKLAEADLGSKSRTLKAKAHKIHAQKFNLVQEQVAAKIQDLNKLGVKLAPDLVDKLLDLNYGALPYLDQLAQADQAKRAELIRQIGRLSPKELLWGGSWPIDQVAEERMLNRPGLDRLQVLRSETESGDFWSSTDRVEMPGVYRLQRSQRQANGDIDVIELLLRLDPGCQGLSPEQVAEKYAWPGQVQLPGIKNEPLNYLVSDLFKQELEADQGVLIYLGQDEPSIRIRKELAELREDPAQARGIRIVTKEGKPEEAMIREAFLEPGYDAYLFILQEGKLALAREGLIIGLGGLIEQVFT